MWNRLQLAHVVSILMICAFPVSGCFSMVYQFEGHLKIERLCVKIFAFALWTDGRRDSLHQCRWPSLFLTQFCCWFARKTHSNSPIRLKILFKCAWPLPTRGRVTNFCIIYIYIVFDPKCCHFGFCSYICMCAIIHWVLLFCDRCVCRTI